MPYASMGFLKKYILIKISFSNNKEKNLSKTPVPNCWIKIEQECIRQQDFKYNLV